MSPANLFAALVIGELAVRAHEHAPLPPLVPPEPYIDAAILYQKSPTRLYDLCPSLDAGVGRDLVSVDFVFHDAPRVRSDLVRPRMLPAVVARR